MNTFKVGDQVVLVKDVYDLVDNTDSYGYTFKLGDSFEVVNLMSMPNDKWIVKGKVCLEDLEGPEEFFAVKAKEEIKKSALQFKVGDLVRIKEGFQTPLGLAEESIYCVGQLSGMGSLSIVGKAGWFAEKYFELFAQPIKTTSIESDQEHTGGSVNYYKVEVKTPTTFDQPYWAECNDLIEALDMNYAEGNAFKAIWRRCAERQGKKKKGNNTYYDAEKLAFFAQRILEQEKEKQ